MQTINRSLKVDATRLIVDYITSSDLTSIVINSVHILFFSVHCASGNHYAKYMQSNTKVVVMKSK